VAIAGSTDDEVATVTSLRPGLTLKASQNRHLSTEDSEMQMHALLTVTGDRLGSGFVADPTTGFEAVAAEVIIVDCSGSMDAPRTKISAARRAAAAAIDALRDGSLFAVVEGTRGARMVYPSAPGLASANTRTKAEAKAASARLVASGGTAIGTWLTQARELLDQHPPAIRHVILLTDGKNEHETPDELDRVLAACAGHFVCDARGIGTGWEPRELLRITSVLRGVADAVRDVSELENVVREMVANSMHKFVPDVRIRINSTAWARLRFLKQVYPVRSDLTEHPADVGDGTTEFSLGDWGDESREYHICFDIASSPRVIGQDLRVAKIDLLMGQEPIAAPQLVLVCWTDDPAISTRLDQKVNYYATQEELQQAVDAGYDAYDAGDHPAARSEWGRAVRLAAILGNAEILERLGRLVDIIDPATGEVKLKENVQPSDLLSLAVGSVLSSRSPDQIGHDEPPDAGPASPDRTCVCGWLSPPDAVVCTKCGLPLETPDE
jgi:hypothetical protein